MSKNQEPATVISEKLGVAIAEAQNELNQARKLLSKLDGLQDEEDTRPTRPVIRVDSLQRKIKFMDGQS